jgi:hypothetical protein
MLTVMVGESMVGQWTTYLVGLGLGINSDPLFYCIMTVLEGLLFLYAVWKLPAVAQHLVGGESSMLTLGEAFSGTVGNAPVGAASGAVSAAVGDLTRETGQAAHAAAMKVRAMLVQTS